MPVVKAAPPLSLPFKVRWKLLRQDLLATFNIGGHVRVTVAPHPLGAEITIPDGQIVAPSVYRWKLYRKGWEARLDQLAAEYGVDRYVQLNAKSLVIDVGANAGEFAHVCARFGATVHCIEPDGAVRACLTHNVRALDQATAHDALLWNEEADVPFVSIPDHADSSVFADGSKTQMRRATTLDRFCTDHKIDRIDLLKCDAEGAEPEVLEGAASMLARTSTVAIDTGAERQGARTHKAVGAILKTHGFRVIDEAVGKRLMTYGLRD